MPSRSKWAKRLSVSIVMALVLAISGITVYANYAPNMSYKLISMISVDNSCVRIDNGTQSFIMIDQYIVQPTDTDSFGMPVFVKVIGSLVISAGLLLFLILAVTNELPIPMVLSVIVTMFVFLLIFLFF